jgi:hypothetical protein
MLAAARRHEFDVIIAEDTSRLWRNLAEPAPRLAELSDLGVHKREVRLYSEGGVAPALFRAAGGSAILCGSGDVILATPTFRLSLAA